MALTSWSFIIGVCLFSASRAQLTNGQYKEVTFEMLSEQLLNITKMVTALSQQMAAQGQLIAAQGQRISSLNQQVTRQSSDLKGLIKTSGQCQKISSLEHLVGSYGNQLTAVLQNQHAQSLSLATLNTMAQNDVKAHNSLREDHRGLNTTVLSVLSEVQKQRSDHAQRLTSQGSAITKLNTALKTQDSKMTTLIQTASELQKCSCQKNPLFMINSPKGRYKATFGEAAKLCKEANAELATMDQLKAGWEMGMDYCDCGWLADGTRGYPSQFPRPDCHNGRGIMICGRNGAGLANVWCFNKYDAHNYQKNTNHVVG